MIICPNEDNGHRWVFKQIQHARACGPAFDFLSPRFYDTDQMACLREVCECHDEGWFKYDNEFINEPLSALIHFPDVDNDRHAEIWKKSVQRCVDEQDYYGAACLCEHASALSDDKPGLSEELHAWRVELLRKAFPDASPEQRNWKLERGFYTLRMVDLMTLAPCAGWSGPIDSTLIDPEGRSQDIRFTMETPWELTLSPWPLERVRAEIEVSGFRFPLERWESSEPFDWSEFQATKRIIVKPG